MDLHSLHKITAVQKKAPIKKGLGYPIAAQKISVRPKKKKNNQPAQDPKTLPPELHNGQQLHSIPLRSTMIGGSSSAQDLPELAQPTDHKATEPLEKADILHPSQERRDRLDRDESSWPRCQAVDFSPLGRPQGWFYTCFFGGVKSRRTVGTPLGMGNLTIQRSGLFDRFNCLGVHLGFSSGLTHLQLADDQWNHQVVHHTSSKITESCHGRQSHPNTSH